LNGLKLGNKYALKCSFGTSKYCANFLKDSVCESFEDEGKTCPFLHYLERSRDKVIQDDPEFREYLGTQDIIANNFLYILGINHEISPLTLSEIFERGVRNNEIRFPCPFETFGDFVQPAL
jgi:hypothetical protein